MEWFFPVMFVISYLAIYLVISYVNENHYYNQNLNN